MNNNIKMGNADENRYAIFSLEIIFLICTAPDLLDTGLAGLFRMIAPVSAQQLVQRTAALYPLLVVLLAFGIFLTYKAYGREETKGE